MTYFPHDEMRPIQEDMVNDVRQALESSGCLIANAPTGLGKTAASLGPALSYAKKHGKVVFFLTSRHTQHSIAIDTIRLIKEKHDSSIVSADIISRQGMCPVPGTATLYSREFTEYCKKMREDEKCEYFVRSRKKGGSLTMNAKKMIEEVTPRLPLHVEEFARQAGGQGLCPYEISVALSKEADVIVCDYYYLLNPTIREIFLAKIGRSLEDIIIIIDEGHNVPGRIRELMSDRLSTRMIERSMKEAKKHGYEEIEDVIGQISEIVQELKEGCPRNGEMKIEKKDLLVPISKIRPYEELCQEMMDIGDDIRVDNKQSSIGSLGEFLKRWMGGDEGFVRFIRRTDELRNPLMTISYNCMDPSLNTAEVLENCYSAIMMSGTLTPTDMYRDVLGFPAGTIERDYPSPFPKDNRLTFVVPNVTTKYTSRNPAEFRKIAEVCAEITDSVPGNSLIFFPSYYLLREISASFNTISKKTIFQEYQNMSKYEKEGMLEKLREYRKTGAVLLACASGSFGEGIDLPNDELEAVVVVGLPLQPPDLETKELIAYYDRKYSRGWDYGYILPAITKTLQNAGRCIRTENDRGVIAFLDNRYLYSNYQKCFPKEWTLESVTGPAAKVRGFFKHSPGVNSKKVINTQTTLR